MSEIEEVRREAERRFGHRAKVSVDPQGGIRLEVVDGAGTVRREGVSGPYFDYLEMWLDELALAHG